MRALGLETSCDETAAAVVELGESLRGTVLADVVHTQKDVHEKWGGVVPELASRDHLQRVLPVLDEALRKAGCRMDQLEGISVTRGPGLVGAHVDGLARAGNPEAIDFPRGLSRRSRAAFDFSFSGLKTAVLTHVQEHGAPSGQALADLCASFQEAVCDAVTQRAVRAARHARLSSLVICGGVAANSRLRELAAERCDAEGISLFLPEARLCTDNAAMIAIAGAHRLRRGERADPEMSADPGWRL